MKKREFIGGLVSILAFLWVLGTVGALECDNITILQAVVQSAIGIVVGWIGLKIAGAELN